VFQAASLKCRSQRFQTQADWIRCDLALCYTHTGKRNSQGRIVRVRIMVRFSAVVTGDCRCVDRIKVADCPAVRSRQRWTSEAKTGSGRCCIGDCDREPPLFVTRTATLLLFPRVTLPKFTLLGFAVRDPGATPVPETRCSKAIRVHRRQSQIALTLPDAAGVNFTEKFADWLGVSVVGSVRPTTVKPPQSTVACEIVTFDPPCWSEFPAGWYAADLNAAKARVVGFAESAPAVAPLPESAILRFGLNHST